MLLYILMVTGKKHFPFLSEDYLNGSYLLGLSTGFRLLAGSFLFFLTEGTKERVLLSYREEETEDTGKDADEALVSASREGDMDAFECLVRKYQSRMMNMAFRMTGDYDDACETVQETFLSAYRSIRKFRGEAKFSTWLYGICINHAKNRVKQTANRGRYEAYSRDDPPSDEEGGFPPEPSSLDLPAVDQLVRKELQTKVQKCIDSLEKQHREVLVLRDIEGFAYDEMSGILGLPEGTIKSRLFRAREALKNSLKKIIGDY
jgi:RNA polymerase sigma-70 factor, ECF subfamily